MPQSVAVYVRRQGASAAVINMALNPALAWVGNRGMRFMPLRSIVSDAAVTSVVLSLLVALFVTSGVHRDLKAGRVRAVSGFSREGRLLSRLPGHSWALGLMLGFGIAFVLAPLTCGLFHLAGIPGLCFARFALFKAVYTGLLGFVVTRWVILRQLLRVSLT
ncbi:MAG: hypothetical protein WCP22_00265 [Chlamydiota bacterium]